MKRSNDGRTQIYIPLDIKSNTVFFFFFYLGCTARHLQAFKQLCGLFLFFAQGARPGIYNIRNSFTSWFFLLKVHVQALQIFVTALWVVFLLLRVHGHVFTILITALCSVLQSTPTQKYEEHIFFDVPNDRSISRHNKNALSYMRVEDSFYNTVY